MLYEKDIFCVRLCASVSSVLRVCACFEGMCVLYVYVHVLSARACMCVF